MRVWFSIVLIICLTACTENYYSEVDFSSAKKIDTHIHIHTKNNAIPEMAKSDGFQLLNVSVDVPSYPPVEEQEEYSLYQVEAYPNTVNYLTAFTLARWDSFTWTRETIDELKTSFENGALGIKVWKNIGMTYRDSLGNFIMIDNPRFDSVINYVIAQNKTVMGHLGEPKNCWLPIEEMTVNNDKNYFKNNPEYHMYLHPEYPSYEDQINARDYFLARHPDMRFVGAHLGSLEYNVDSLARRLDRFPNMAVDMAARICHLQYQSKQDREKIRNFMIQFQDRLIYGSDTGMAETSSPEEVKRSLHKRWIDDWKYFTTDQKMEVAEVDGEFDGLKLPKEVVDKIYYSNAVKWFGIGE